MDHFEPSSLAFKFDKNLNKIFIRGYLTASIK